MSFFPTKTESKLPTNCNRREAPHANIPIRNFQKHGDIIPSTFREEGKVML